MRQPPILASKFVRILDKIMHAILVLSGAVIVMMVTYYVFTRYLFKMNFPGFEELCTLVIVWMYFIGSANASREQTHISADMLELFVRKAKTRQVIIILRRIVGVAVIAVMAYLSVDFMVFSAAQGASSTNYHIPMYFYHISLVLGMFLMLFYDACYLVNDIIVYRHPELDGRKSETEEAPE